MLGFKLKKFHSLEVRFFMPTPGGTEIGLRRIKNHS